MDVLQKHNTRLSVAAAVLISIAIFAIVFSFIYAAALRIQVVRQDRKILELEKQINNLDLSIDQQGEKMIEGSTEPESAGTNVNIVPSNNIAPSLGDEGWLDYSTNFKVDFKYPAAASVRYGQELGEYITEFNDGTCLASISIEPITITPIGDSFTLEGSIMQYYSNFFNVSENVYSEMISEKEFSVDGAETITIKSQALGEIYNIFVLNTADQTLVKITPYEVYEGDSTITCTGDFNPAIEKFVSYIDLNF